MGALGKYLQVIGAVLREGNSLVSNTETVKDVLIIGSGPAGLSASIYTVRAGLDTVVVTGPQPGGLVATTGEVDNYLGLPGATGQGLAEDFLEHSRKLGVLHISDSAEKIEYLPEKGLYRTSLEGTGESILSKTLIYTAGSRPRKLGIEGGDSSLLSYCATCDGAFYKGEKVLLVGAGETAFEDALYLSGLAEKVAVLVRNKISATLPLQEKVRSTPNIEIREGVEITEITEKEKRVGIFTNKVLDTVTLSTGEVLSKDSGDFGGIFIAIGQEPVSGLVEPFVELSESGFVKKVRGEYPGLYVAGDLADEDNRQIIIAAGSGAKTAMQAIRYLS